MCACTHMYIRVHVYVYIIYAHALMHKVNALPEVFSQYQEIVRSNFDIREFNSREIIHA